MTWNMRRSTSFLRVCGNLYGMNITQAEKVHEQTKQLFGVCLVWYCLWYCNSIYSYMYLQLHVTYISFRCLAFYLFFVVGVSFVCRQSGMPPFPPGILSQSACVWYEYVFFSDRQQYVLRYFSRPHTPLARAIDVPHHANISFDEVFDLPGEVSF